MADTTYYVNPVAEASGDWAAGSNANNGLSIAAPKLTLANVIENHASGSGETVTVNIIPGGTLAEGSLVFWAAGMNGVHFVFQTDEDSTWNMGAGTANTDFFIPTVPTTGSITIRRAVINNANTKSLFGMPNGKGMNGIVDDCSITLTNANGRLYYCGTTGGARSIRVMGSSVINTTNNCIYNPEGEIVIEDGCSLTSAATVLSLNVSCTSLKVGAATLTSTGDRGILFGDNKTMNLFSCIGTTIVSDDEAIVIPTGIPNVIIKGCTITSNDAAYGVSINAGLAAAPMTYESIIIDGNTITSIANAAIALNIGYGVQNISVFNNRLYGYGHSLFFSGKVGLVAYNVITSLHSVSCALYGSDVTFHHNTCYGADGGALVTGAGGGSLSGVTYNKTGDELNALGGMASGETCYVNANSTGGTTRIAGYVYRYDGAAWNFVQSMASVNLKIFSNILVSVNSLAYNDYDDTAGLPNGRSVGDKMNDYVDGNVYWRVTDSASGIVKIGQDTAQQVADTVAELQTAWLTATTGGGPWCDSFSHVNDLNSLMVNPNLDSNYRPRNRTIARLGYGAVAPNAQTLGGNGVLEIAP